MSDTSTLNSISALDPSLLNGSKSGAAAEKRNPGQVQQEEFLQLLVHQLKNQDPLNPMENDEFAVKLAQFSQVEQLVNINETLSGEKGGGFSSMASYLGHEVIVPGDEINLRGGKGDSSISYVLPLDAQSVVVELLDKDGNVVGTTELGPQSSGRNRVDIETEGVANGSYTARVQAITSAGESLTPDIQLSGIVSGFVPGPDGTLLVGDKEITPAEIIEVRVLGNQA